MMISTLQVHADGVLEADVFKKRLTSNDYLDSDGNLDLSNASNEDFLALFFKITFDDKMGELSENTLKAYRTDLKTLLHFLEEVNLGFCDIGFLEVRTYNQYINSKYANRSAIRKLDFFRRILEFGYQTKFYSSVLAPWIQKPKSIKGHYSGGDNMNRKEIRELPQQEAQMLIKAMPGVVKTNRGIKQTLMLRNSIFGHLLLTTGLRASEVVGLNWGSFRKTNKGYIVADVIGKGGKERTVPIREETIDIILRYRKMLGERVEWNRYDETPLFYRLDRRGKQRITYDTLYKVIKAAVLKVGENPNVSPHWFRHSFVTIMLENDLPLSVVKDLAGHSDIATTNLYLERMEHDKMHEHTDRVNFNL